MSHGANSRVNNPRNVILTMKVILSFPLLFLTIISYRFEKSKFYRAYVQTKMEEEGGAANQGFKEIFPNFFFQKSKNSCHSTILFKKITSMCHIDVFLTPLNQFNDRDLIPSIFLK